MSRIGKQILQIPEGVKVAFDNDVLVVEGKNGKLQRKIREEVEIKINKDKVTATPTRNSRLAKALWGTYVAHISNMFKGVTEGHETTLTVEGVGYRAEVKGKDLVLTVGYSNPVTVPIEDGLSVKVEKKNIVITGTDIEQVTSFASRVRMVRKPEPYKGKGIRYENEVVRRKQGKKVATK